MIERKVRSIGHGFAVFALIVSVQAVTPACSSRSGVVPAQPGPAPQAQGIPTPTAEPAPEIVPDECSLTPPAGESIATVGLIERVDSSHAPRPTNPSERLFFSQLYETLVRVDCVGRLRPGLASSWRPEPSFVAPADSNARLWIVTLRENARFDDGTPVTAAAVHASWLQNGGRGPSRQYVSRLLSWVDEVDDRTLTIQLNSDRSDAPAALAHPDLAVARRTADSPWPLGTRSSQLEATAVRGNALSELTVRRDTLPPLRFLVAPGDPRDLLDRGVDLLVTRDPATLDYAATLPHLQRVPLAWQRTYVYLTAGRSPSSPSLSEEARQALAADAVRGEARGAQGPFWFETAECPPFPRGGMTPQVPTRRIVYDAADPVARDLAERFVALAGSSGPAATAFLEAVLPDRPRRTVERATGLTGDALTKARGQGTDAGYIAFVDRRPFDSCDAKYTLFLGPFQWATTILPLVDTRQQALVRRGRSGITTDFDGSVLIDDVNDPRSR